jgi:hypothetical protein
MHDNSMCMTWRRCACLCWALSDSSLLHNRMRRRGTMCTRISLAPFSITTQPLVPSPRKSKSCVSSMAHLHTSYRLSTLITSSCTSVSPHCSTHCPCHTMHRLMDILIVRPMCHPLLGGKDGQAECRKFKERIWSTISGMYQDGVHNYTWYTNPDGQADGPPVVEYFRVRGWEWIPVSVSQSPSPSTDTDYHARRKTMRKHISFVQTEPYSALRRAERSVQAC